MDCSTEMEYWNTGMARTTQGVVIFRS